MSRPRFNTLYTGAWEYEPQEGVGLRFTGQPNDIDGAVDLMWTGYSCIPHMGYKIIHELISNGFRDVTVMSFLDFDKLAKELSRFNIFIEIIAPKAF